MTLPAPLSCTVRLSSETDLAEVVKLCDLHAIYERTAINTTGLQQRLAVAINGEPEQLIIMVALHNDQIIAYASASRAFSTWTGCEYLTMDCLFVLEAFRGSGAGTKLFDAISNEAKRAEITRVEWQTPNWNSDAIGFYHVLGATSMAKVRFQLAL